MPCPHRRVGTRVALVLVAVAGSAVTASPALGARASERPVRAVPKDLATAFPVLRRPAVTKVPARFEAMATSPAGTRLGIDASLTRLVAVPGIADPWYLIPGRRGVCFRNATTGTCMPTKQALAGGLLIESIRSLPGAGAHDSPLPSDHGLPETSTITGIAPNQFDRVTATTRSGATVVARTSRHGAYRVTGTDILTLEMTRTPIEVSLRQP